MGPQNYEEQHEKWMEETERKKQMLDDERFREFLLGELEEVQGRMNALHAEANGNGSGGNGDA